MLNAPTLFFCLAALLFCCGFYAQVPMWLW